MMSYLWQIGIVYYLFFAKSCLECQKSAAYIYYSTADFVISNTNFGMEIKISSCCAELQIMFRQLFLMDNNFYSSELSSEEAEPSELELSELELLCVASV